MQTLFLNRQGRQERQEKQIRAISNRSDIETAQGLLFDSPGILICI